MPPFIWPRPVTIQIRLFDPVHSIHNSTRCTNEESQAYSHGATYFSTQEEHVAYCKRAGHSIWHMSEWVDSNSLTNQAWVLRGRVVDPTLRPLHSEGKSYTFSTSLIFIWSRIVICNGLVIYIQSWSESNLKLCEYGNKPKRAFWTYDLDNPTIFPLTLPIILVGETSIIGIFWPHFFIAFIKKLFK